MKIEDATKGIRKQLTIQTWLVAAIGIIVVLSAVARLVVFLR